MSTTTLEPAGHESSSDKLSLEMSWDALKELGASERHFNGLETEYRKLASIWLLAGFAGIGFIIKQSPELVVPRELVIMGIGLATSIGILLLWIVDLLVYHRLLDACFSEALRIEGLYPELPKVRRRMAESQSGGRVVTTRLRWFYIALTAAPVLFAAPRFGLWCRQQFDLPGAWMAAAGSGLYLGLTTLMIWKKGSSRMEGAQP
jgi:hypothetical protein